MGGLGEGEQVEPNQFVSIWMQTLVFENLRHQWRPTDFGFDLDSKSSFFLVKRFVYLFQEKMCEGAVLLLLGNKLDLADSGCRKVTTGEAQRLADVRHIKIFKQLNSVVFSWLDLK